MIRIIDKECSTILFTLHVSNKSVLKCIIYQIYSDIIRCILFHMELISIEIFHYTLN